MKQEKEMDCQTLICDSSTRANHCFLYVCLFLQYLLIVSEHHHVVHLFKAHLSDQLS